MRSPLSQIACAVVAGAVLAGSVAGVLAAFGSATANGGNVVTSVPDFTAPDVVAVAIGEEGGAAGTVAAGGAYYVYADVLEDGGNPPSGTAAVTADVSELTAGSTAVALLAGSYTTGGETYNRRSAELTADAPLAEGEKGFTVTAVDNASNDETEPGTVTVVAEGP